MCRDYSACPGFVTLNPAHIKLPNVIPNIFPLISCYNIFPSNKQNIFKKVKGQVKSTDYTFHIVQQYITRCPGKYGSDRGLTLAIANLPNAGTF